jgi:hypothetical protein
MTNLARIGAALGFCLLTATSLPTSAFAFGALAIQSNHGGNIGWSHNYNTKEDAEDRAMSECGPHCTVVLDYWNGCAAYATDQSGGSTVYGWGTGDTRGNAEDSAQQQCEEHGGDQCTIQVWSCE